MSETVNLWGFDTGCGDYRAPLPIVGVHTARERKGLDEPHPPYIVASKAGRWDIFVMLCDGDGWRATEDGTGQKDKGKEDWIYADGDNVPEEWKEPIAEALRAIRQHWRGRRLHFRDNPRWRAVA